jgi:hypothetical protein
MFPSLTLFIFYSYNLFYRDRNIYKSHKNYKYEVRSMKDIFSPAFEVENKQASIAKKWPIPSIIYP